MNRDRNTGHDPALPNLSIDTDRKNDFLTKIQNKTAQEIEASIRRRQKKLETLTTEGRTDQALEWELQKLREKKSEIDTKASKEKPAGIDISEKQEFSARIRKKTEDQLRNSIKVRERILAEKKENGQDTGKVEWEIEKLKKRIQPYDRVKLFKEYRSPILEADPNAKLDQYKEIERYIGTFTPEYRKQVEGLMSQIKEPMGAEVKIVSCIPAAGHQEGENIYQTLKNYSFQKDSEGHRLKTNSFEIVIFVNHPQVDKKGKTIKPDKTVSEIKRFQKNHPEVAVRFMYEALPPEQAKIGTVRKLLNDTVLMRHHARGTEAADLIMVSNDADNKGVSPQYFTSFLKKFENDPEIEGILGQLDWDPEAYIRYPEVFVGTRLFQYLNARGRIKRGRVPSSGANFAFKSSIFAGIGGYLSELEGGEDVAIGRAIVMARKNRNAIGYSKSSLLYTSARRSIDMWEKNGLVPIQQWDRGFSAFDELRKQDLDRSVDVNYDDPEVQKKLITNLELVVNKTLDVYEAGEKLGKKNRIYRKTLNALGIRLNLSKTGEIIITDISRLIIKLKQYKELAVLHRDKESGKPESRAQYDERKRQLEQEKEAQQEQTKKDYDEKYKSFRGKAQLPKISSSTKASIKASEEKLFASQDTSEIGDYVIVNDALVKNEDDRTADRSIKLGYNKNTREVVIIKQIDKDAIDYFKEIPGEEKDREKILVEKEAQHPNLQLPIERFEQDGQIIRVYKRGSEDLRSYMERKKTLTPKEGISVIMPIIDAVKELHKHGAIHTDISTSNILFVDNDVKLIDLDEAVFVQGQANKFAYKKGARGNRYLLPPELMKPWTTSANGETYRLEKTADIYETAASLYRIIIGTWPHKVPEAERNVPKNPDAFEIFHKARFLQYAEAKKNQPIPFPDTVPQALQDVLKKAMYPYPEGRYQSMEEFGLALMDAYEKLV